VNRRSAPLAREYTSAALARCKIQAGLPPIAVIQIKNKLNSILQCFDCFLFTVEFIRFLFMTYSILGIAPTGNIIPLFVIGPSGEKLTMNDIEFIFLSRCSQKFFQHWGVGRFRDVYHVYVIVPICCRHERNFRRLR